MHRREELRFERRRVQRRHPRKTPRLHEVHRFPVAEQLRTRENVLCAHADVSLAEAIGHHEVFPVRADVGHELALLCLGCGTGTGQADKERSLSLPGLGSGRDAL